MRELFEKILYETEKGHDLALVTLIHHDGSAPRKTGSQMLVGANGLLSGTIGGGSVELHSIEMAKDILTTKKAYRHEFYLRSNIKEDIGMICGGDVTAFFEFIAADDPGWKDLCIKALERFAVQEGGWFVQNIQNGEPSLFDTDMHLLCGTDPKSSRPVGNSPQTIETFFWMPLPLSERAIIFGGGHIAAALVPLLTSVGFRPWIFDERTEFSEPDNYPQAEKCITGDFARISDYIEITEKDYVVIMTNGHAHDLEAELHVLRGQFAYIGVTGSRRKAATINAKLRDQGISDELIAQVHSPIGTAIKAVTPEEIAVSIAGEMILVRAERREAGKEIKQSCPMS